MICFYISIHTYTRVVRVYYYIYRYVVIDTQIIFFKRIVVKCRSHQFDPRTWECLKYLGSTGRFTSQETSQWRETILGNAARLSQLQGCREFRLAETLITFLKYIIKLIRFVKISTDLLLYFSHFPKDSHNTSEFLDNNHTKLDAFSPLRNLGWFRVSPRQDMVSYFQNVPARDSTVHIRADPWPRYTMKDRYTKRSIWMVCERHS